MKHLVAFILSAISAYSLSFALDLLLGGMVGFYPSTAFLPVVTWSIIATICGILSLRLAHAARFLAIPALVLACLALFGGVVGRHYSLIVGVGMLAQAYGVWLATAQKKSR